MGKGLQVRPDPVFRAASTLARSLYSYSFHDGGKEMVLRQSKRGLRRSTSVFDQPIGSLISVNIAMAG